MNTPTDPIVALPRPYGARVVRRSEALPCAFRVVLLSFSAMHEDEDHPMLSFLVWVDPGASHIRSVDQVRRDGPSARTLRASFERACFAPLQGRSGVPLGITTREESLALGLGTAVPELPCSLDDAPLDARLSIEAAFLGLASL